MSYKRWSLMILHSNMSRCIIVYTLLSVLFLLFSAAISCPVVDPRCYCRYQQLPNSTVSLQYVACNDLGVQNQVPAFQISYGDTEELLIGGNTTIYQLQDGAFANLKAKRLGLKNIGLVVVNHVTFGGLETLVTTIDLSFNKITSLPYDAFIRLTVLKTLVINDNQLTTFDQSAFRGLYGLQALDISSNNLTQLPYVVFQDLLSLTVLDLHANALTTFYTDQLSNCQQIELFDISGNLWRTTVDQLQFHTLTSLSVINLSNNRLSGNLTSNVFSGLQRLTSVDLSRNSIQSLSADSFRRCVSLIFLDVSYNDISFLPVGIFTDLQQLRVLDITGNNIAVLSASLFQSLSSLAELRANRNVFNVLPSGVLDGCRNLSRVDFSSNRIVYVADDAFVDNSSVRVLNLSNNSLTRVGNFLRRLEWLVVLDLSRNLIAVLSWDTFVAQINLVNINVSYNTLSSLPATIFQQCRKLAVADLSGNQITSVAIGSFVGPEALRTLNLSGNLLPVLDIESIPSDSLTLLSLAGNPLQCSCSLQWMRSYGPLVGRQLTKCCERPTVCRQFVCSTPIDSCSTSILFPLCHTTAVPSTASGSTQTSGYSVTWSATRASTVNKLTSLEPSRSPSSSSQFDDSILTRDQLIIVCVIATGVGTTALVTIICVIVCLVVLRQRKSSPANISVRNGSVYRHRESTDDTITNVNGVTVTDDMLPTVRHLAEQLEINSHL